MFTRGTVNQKGKEMRLAIVREMRRLFGENGERFGQGSLALVKRGHLTQYLSLPEEEIRNMCLIGACSYAVAKLKGKEKKADLISDLYDVSYDDPDGKAVLLDLLRCVPDNEPDLTKDMARRGLENKDLPQAVFDGVIRFNDSGTWERVNQLLECAEKAARTAEGEDVK